MFLLGYPAKKHLTVVQSGGDKRMHWFFCIIEGECGLEFSNISEVEEGGFALFVMTSPKPPHQFIFVSTHLSVPLYSCSECLLIADS